MDRMTSRIEEGGAHASMFAYAALTLHELGATTLPIPPSEKRPHQRLRWRRYASEQPSSRTIQRWIKDYPDHGVGLVLTDDLVHLDADTPASLQRISDLPSAWWNPNSRKHPGGGGALVRVRDLPRRNLAFSGLEVRGSGLVVLPEHDGRRSLHGLGTVQIVHNAPALSLGELAERVGVDVGRFSRDISPHAPSPGHHRRCEYRCAGGGGQAAGTLVRLSQPDALPAVGAFLGLPTSELYRDFKCVLHPESSPSAALIQGDNGVVVYHDRHCQGLEILTLPELYAALVSGEARQIRRVELALWAQRLLVRAGVEEPVHVDLPDIPGAPEHVRRVRRGFADLVAVKWAKFPGSPTAFSRLFASRWCGVSEAQAAEALKLLRARGVMKKAGAVPGLYGREAGLWLPGP